jgi:MoaD family protein
MTITVNLPTILAKLADTKSIETRAPTVAEAIVDLAKRYPPLASRLRDASGRPYPFVAIYVNNHDIRRGAGLETALADGDEITIVPAIAGG